MRFLLRSQKAGFQAILLVSNIFLIFELCWNASAAVFSQIVTNCWWLSTLSMQSKGIIQEHLVIKATQSA